MRNRSHTFISVMDVNTVNDKHSRRQIIYHNIQILVKMSFSLTDTLSSISQVPSIIIVNKASKEHNKETLFLTRNSQRIGLLN